MNACLAGNKTFYSVRKNIDFDPHEKELLRVIDVDVITGDSSQLSPMLYEKLLVYRRQVFIDKLGWELKTLNGMELDQFDRSDTMYVVSENSYQQVNGCARLLPTIRPYLLGEVFPQLMNGQAIPCSPDIWELSRFAALDFNTATAKASSQINSPIVSTLLHESIACVARQGAHWIITVSPVGIERMLNRLNVYSCRAGPPMVINGQRLFACWIGVD